MSSPLFPGTDVSPFLPDPESLATLKVLNLVLLTLLGSILTVLFTIPLINNVARRCNQVDRPSARKVHQRSMVRLGGIAIAAGVLVGFGITCWSQSISPLALPSLIWAILLGGASFFLIGLADDLVGLPALSRLGMQSAIAIVVWSMGLRIDFVSVPILGLVQMGMLSLPITLLWLTGVVNAINWIDGLDGLAAGVSAIAATVMLVICLHTDQPLAVLLLLPLIGSLVGFLYYNFNPASIFMGDGGAYLIGFLLSSLSILGLTKTATATAIALPGLILAVPLVDMSAVILMRLWHRQSPFKADQRHLHHRLLSAGIPHRTTVLLIYAMTSWASSLAILLVDRPIGFLALSVATLILAPLGWYAYQRRFKSP